MEQNLDAYNTHLDRVECSTDGDLVAVRLRKDDRLDAVGEGVLPVDEGLLHAAHGPAAGEEGVDGADRGRGGAGQGQVGNVLGVLELERVVVEVGRGGDGAGRVQDVLRVEREHLARVGERLVQDSFQGLMERN